MPTDSIQQRKEELSRIAAGRLVDLYQKDYQALINDFNNDIQNFVSDWQPADILNNYNQRINQLRHDARYISSAQNYMKDKTEKMNFVDRLVTTKNALDNMDKQLGNVSRYWGNWDSEDAYKSSKEFYSNKYNGQLSDWEEMINNSSQDKGTFGTWIWQDKRRNNILTGETNRKAVRSGKAATGNEVDYMTDDELNIYHYLYSKEGKDAANKYLDTLGDTLKSRVSQGYNEVMSKSAKEQPVMASLMSIPLNMASAIEYPAAAVKKLFGHDLDPLSFKTSDMSNAIRGTVANDIGGTKGFLYQTGMSIADTLARLPMGNLGLFVAGSQAAGSSASDIMQRGGKDWQALIGGGITGVWEGVFEKVSLGSLTALKEAPATTVKAFFTNILKQSTIEASEEAFTEIADALTDYVVMGDLSNWITGYNKYLNEGYSESEAWKKVVLDTAKDVSASALGGFISGAVMSPGAQALGIHNAYKEGSQIENMSNIDSLAEYAIHNLDETKNAYKIAKQYVENSADVSKTVLAPMLESAINEEINQKHSTSKLKFWDKQYTNNINTILQGRELLNNALIDNVNTDLSGNAENTNINIKTQFVDTITQEFVKNGVSADIAPQNAELVTKILSGENLSAKELRTAASDYNIKNILTEHAGIDFTNNASADRKAISSYVDSMAAQKTENTSTVKTDTNTKSGTTAATDPLMEAAEAQVAAQIHEPQNAVTNAGDSQNQTQKSTAAPSAPVKSASQSYGEAGKAGYETYKNEYSSELSGQYYDDVFHMLYQAGKAGLPYKELKNFGDLLPKQIRKAAYDAGVVDVAHIKAKQAEINTAIKAEQKQVEQTAQGKPGEADSTENQNSKSKQPAKESSKQGTVKREYSKDTKISEHTKNQIDVIERVAEATGINFVVFESKVDENGNYIDENGRYDVDSNTVYIEVHAGLKNVSDSMHTALVNTASHELTHFIRQWSPAQYAKLQEFLVGEFGVDFTEGRIKEITETYAKKGIELTYEQAMEELVANSCNNMLLNSKAAIKLARQNMTLAKQIKSWIDEWTEKVKAAFTGDRRGTAESMELLQKSKATLQKAQAIWDRALVEATRNYNTSYKIKQNNTNNMYELREYSDKQKENWKKSKSILVYESTSQLEDFIHQSLNDKTLNQKIYFGAIPDNLAERIYKETGLDVKDFNCTIHSYEIRKILNKSHGDENAESLRGQRAITVSDIISIPEIIQNPDRIKLGDKLYDGKPVIEFEKTVNGKTTVISYASAKHKDLRVQTMYAGINKRSLSTATDVKSPVITSETTAGTASITNSISTNEQKSQGKLSLRENEDNNVDIINNKKYNEKGDYYGREQENGEPDNTEAGRDGRVSGQIQSNSDMEYEKTLSGLDGRKNYRGIESTLKAKLVTQGISPVELRYNSNAAKFADSIQLAKENNSHGAYVTQYSTEEYRNMSLFLSDDGNVGVALHDTEHGTDIVSVFKNPDAKVKKSVSSILLTAIQNGGNKLDNFNGNLSIMYAQHGFIPVARCAFNEEFAPTDWNYERDGKPDIIFWVHDGNNVESIVDHLSDRVLIDIDKIPLFDDYDDAGEYRDSLIASLSKNISEKTIYEAIDEIPIAKENGNYDQSTRFQLRDDQYSYGSIINKQDMNIVSLENDIPYTDGKIDKNTVVDKARSNVRDKNHPSNTNTAIYVHVPDIDKTVTIGKDGIIHGFERDYSIQAKVAMNVADVLENSIAINELNGRTLYKYDKNGQPDYSKPKYKSDMSYVLLGLVKDKKDIYAVRTIVDKVNNEALDMEIYRLYALRAKRETLPSPLSGDTAVGQSLHSDSGSLKLSIKDVLDIVKSNNLITSVLSESVLDSMGVTRDSDEFAGRLRYQLREEMERSDRELLADALVTIATNQQERDRLGAYKRAIKNLDDWQGQLTDVNRQLKELSFAKGERDVEKINNLKAQKQNISNKLNWWDKRLIGLEAEQPIRDLIARERNRSLDKFKAEIAKAKAEGKQILSQKLLDQKAEYEARIKRDRERRFDTADRRKQREYIKKQVKKMNNLLIHETDMKHVPQALKKPVADFLTIFTEDDTGVFDYKKLGRLKSAYDEIGSGEYDNTALSVYFDGDISSELENLKNTIDGRRLSELTVDELHSVKNIVDHFKHIIKTENELFVNGKKVDYEKYGKRAMQELSSKGPKYNNVLIAKSKTLTEFKNLITSKNITPAYFFKNVGGAVQELYQNIENGQYRWATNIYGSREFYVNTAERFHVKDWVDVKNDTIEFTSERGKKINLTRQQALSVYALSKRKQGLLHLKGGGIVIENDLIAEKKKGKIINYTYKQNDTVQLSDVDLTKINSWLTKEQKLFADEMVRYLSQDMARLGNEVSMALYGYEKFGEDYYFPIISSDNYLYSKQGQVMDPRLKNQSYTKQTVENANNPVVVKDFIEIWGDHVNRMELYNALAVPLETFNRIYNYKDTVIEGKNAKSIKALLKNAYGEEAARYIDNLMKDINGGIRGDGAESWQNSWVNKFKKNAVFASLSVLIQQPSAIGRAMALVDPKYFIASAFDQVKQKNTYAELKQYAPVAIIKEMGRFDTGTGASTVNWLISFTYDSIAEKSAAFLKDSDYRDEILSKGPSKADEITWCHLWEAIKRETVDKTGLSITSEELLQKAGERFTEVINLTQVYDSVFSRSELMRSKSGMVKMLTAFMAEPTLSYNMLYDAAKQAKTGGKAGKVYFARAVGAFAFSVVLNSVLKSLVTAARDDDDDETYTEKYVGALAENILSDLNPLSLIPWVKDALSILDGYSVERSDMSLISDLYEATTNLDSESISAWEKQERFIGAIAALFGVPYRNISRDIRSLRNVIVDWTDDLDTTKAGLKYSVLDAINNSSWLASSIFDLDSGSNADKLYHAIVEGDEASIEKYESIIGKDKLESNIRKGLKNNSELVMEAALLAIDGRFVDYSDVFDQIEAQGFERDDIISAINSIENMVGKVAKAKQKGDNEEYEKAIDALRDIDMPDADIKRAVGKYPVSDIEESKTIETYESIYSGKQLAYAVDDGSDEDIKTIIADLTKEYDEKLRAKGKSESQIKQGIASSLRSTLTSYFKPLYQECYRNKDYDGMQEIRDKLNALRSYGIKYRGDDYADWVKELANKKIFNQDINH